MCFTLYTTYIRYIITHYIKNRNHTQKLNTMMETRKGSKIGLQEDQKLKPQLKN